FYLFLISSPSSPLFPYTTLFRSVSAPGPINPVSGTILTPPNLSGAKNLKITELLEIRYDLPTILEVDANASALAEQWFGSSKERSEEHTSELQSRFDLVCRLLLE